MIEYKSPEKYDLGDKSVFLGGSLTIEYDWRNNVVNHFKDYDVTFLNPNREDIEEIVEDASNSAFVEHVTWVNNAIEDAKIIFMMFDPNTQSPMSLLDFVTLCKYKDTIVCCPDGFWKKTLIKSACIEFNVPLYDTYEEAIKNLESRL